MPDETTGLVAVEITPDVWRSDRPTPNGGAYSIAYFTDEDGNPAPKSQASRVEIHEMDANGESIFRTYGNLRPGGDHPPP
ncbi:MAG: hypothetical protein K0Q72_4842 [Armatimonadetes bacterium]|jgi:hypothetical protein|nr:hypothetical protein [Armatimonadota bacterium]